MEIGTTLAGFSGERFQRLASALLAAEMKDFQAVNGAGGDDGNDGYAPSLRTLFQMYAPEKVVTSRLRSKIDETLKKVVLLRKKARMKIERVVLVTPFDLTVGHHLHFQSGASSRKLVADSLGRSRMVTLVAIHPKVARAFPEFEMLAVADALKPDPKHIREVMGREFFKAAVELQVIEFLDHLKLAEREVLVWLSDDPARKRNFTVHMSNVHLDAALVGTLSRDLGEVHLAGAVRETIDSVKAMTALHKATDWNPPQADQEPLVAKFRQHAEAAHNGLQQLMDSWDDRDRRPPASS